MTDPRHASIHGPDAQALGTPPVLPSLPDRLRSGAEHANSMARHEEESAGYLHTRLTEGEFTKPEGAANLALAIIEAHARADRWSHAEQYLRDLVRDLVELDEDAPAQSTEPTTPV